MYTYSLTYVVQNQRLRFSFFSVFGHTIERPMKKFVGIEQSETLLGIIQHICAELNVLKVWMFGLPQDNTDIWVSDTTRDYSRPVLIYCEYSQMVLGFCLRQGHQLYRI